ncbi:uncharacterized protein B0T15DRAFT_255170 [Chaetomium strumarium]|uniref:Mid2 domain-containing protein n=1 Tax=Chaetomium strumarium TaxID=1170767 RepID=A0AAJ0GS16_9PEZI|nr:hypothetical protein B0T15DRAFT_255170 [Chaetomium strumarium]
MCLSNRSCKGPKENIIRDSCTDQSWGSLDCPLYCYLTPNIGPDLISCANVTRRDTSFCCDGTVDCCNTGLGRFELLPSNPEVWATWDNTKSQFVVAKPLSPATAVTTSSFSTSTTSTTAMQMSTIAANTATSPSAPPPAQTAPGGSGQAHLSGLSSAAQAGIGVGISVSAILLGLIAYLLWKLYRNKVQGQQQNQPYNPCQFSSQPEIHPYPKELPCQEQRTELDGLREPTELPGAVNMVSRGSDKSV